MLRILSPYSDPWIAWTMLLLLGLLLFANLFQPGLIRNCFATAFSVKERDSIFSQASSDIRASICLYIYKFIIIPLAFYVVINETPTYFFITLAKLSGIVLGTYLLKLLCNVWLMLTFFDSKVLNNCSKQYANLLTMISTLLYPFTLVGLFFPGINHKILVILGLSIGIFYLICIFIKLFRLFYQKFLVCLYILLYLCTLEIMPLAGIMILGSKIVIG